MHLIVIVVIVATFPTAKGFGGTTEHKIIKEKLKACYNRGGSVVQNQCLCKVGYTGEVCDVALFDVQEKTSKKDYVTKLSVTNSNNSSYKTVAVETFNTNIYRFKRQADEGSGESSGSSPTTTEKTETTTTVFSVSTSSSDVTTTRPQVTCLQGQLLSADQSKCVYPLAFSVRIAVNEVFLTDFSDLNSSAARNFTSRFNREIRQSMANTSFLSFVIISLTNGSVIVNGEMNFEESSNLTTVEANLLLRSRLTGRNNIITIAAGDKNECLDDVCGSNATCANTEGSFLCACSLGFVEVDTSNSDRRKLCQSQCDSFVCLNGGRCVTSTDGEAFCSCSNQFGGVQCENAVFQWLQAAIAVGVVLAVFLLLFIFIVVIFTFRRQTSKHKSTTLPLGTGFRSRTEVVSKGYASPYAVEDEESIRIFSPTQQAHSHKGRLTSTTSTFKPDGVEEDKL